MKDNSCTGGPASAHEKRKLERHEGNGSSDDASR
jgi:hypothetical protein